jgi:hypothetical protein
VKEMQESDSDALGHLGWLIGEAHVDLRGPSVLEHRSDASWGHAPLGAGFVELVVPDASLIEMSDG